MKKETHRKADELQALIGQLQDVLEMLDVPDKVIQLRGPDGDLHYRFPAITAAMADGVRNLLIATEHEYEYL